MGFWLIRAGFLVEYVQEFLDDGRVDKNLWDLEVCL